MSKFYFKQTNLRFTAKSVLSHFWKYSFLMQTWRMTNCKWKNAISSAFVKKLLHAYRNNMKHYHMTCCLIFEKLDSVLHLKNIILLYLVNLQLQASMDGHVEVARLLLDSGAQVNMPTDSFESPLTLAACGGHVDLAMLLIERGANIEEVNDEGYTPLMEAAREGHEEMVALLLSQGKAGFICFFALSSQSQYLLHGRKL